MAHLKTFSTCLVALALHSAAWAEIYETTDAQGNAEFTDSPPSENAEVIDLQQTNIVDAPEQQPQAPQSQQQEMPQGQAPVQENNTVIIHDDPQDDLEEGYLRHERLMEDADPDAPREVLNADAPREVGDSMEQMPREVGDFDSQMPREDGVMEGQVPTDIERYPAHQGEAHRR